MGVNLASKSLTWTCSACGRVGVWGPSWSWYGPLGAQVGESHANGQPMVPDFVACSDQCKAAIAARRLP